MAKCVELQKVSPLGVLKEFTEFDRCCLINFTSSYFKKKVYASDIVPIN
jgi:hypothetical protein